VLPKTGRPGKADPGPELLMHNQGSPRLLFCSCGPGLQNKSLGNPWLCIKSSGPGSAFPGRLVLGNTNAIMAHQEKPPSQIIYNHI
jgi:hypothetical protein